VTGADAQIPVNCPYAARVANHQRDGFMTVNGNGGSAPNYFPNSVGGPQPDAKAADITPFRVDGLAAHHKQQWPQQDDYVQAGNLYRLMPKEERAELVENIVDALRHARVEIQKRQLEVCDIGVCIALHQQGPILTRSAQVFRKCDPDYANQVAAGLSKFGARL
jgi:catalase